MNPVTRTFLVKMLKESYNIIPHSIKALCSYFNINYLVTTKSEVDCGRYVVKIFKTSNPSYFGNAQLQHKIMLHVDEHGLGTSVPLPTVNGETFVKVEYDSDVYLAQVLTFLEGTSAQEASLDEMEMRDVGFQVGQFLGRFHESLEEFADDAMLPTSFPFFAENAAFFLDKIEYVTDPRMARLIKKYMKQYEANFLVHLGELRKGYIHGDFSNTNIIIKKSGIVRDRVNWVVSGAVDFEHCHHGYLVGDLGICIAYFMMQSASIAGSDPISVAKEIVRGYQVVSELTSNEKKVLLDAIIGRMCASYISSSYESYLRPENKEYICLHSKNIQILFDMIEATTREQIIDVLF